MAKRPRSHFGEDIVRSPEDDARAAITGVRDLAALIGAKISRYEIRFEDAVEIARALRNSVAGVNAQKLGRAAQHRDACRDCGVCAVRFLPWPSCEQIDAREAFHRRTLARHVSPRSE